MSSSLNCQNCGLNNLLNARYCAKCGHPLPNSNRRLVITVTAIVGTLGVLGIIGQLAKSPQSPSSAVVQARPTPSIQIDKSPKMQENRQKMINEFIRSGFFSKIEDGQPLVDQPSAFVRVRPAFYALDLDDQQRMVSVIYAYYCTGDDMDFVILEDSRSGKKIGAYSVVFGLKME
jgi:hypothetical protein